MRLFHFRGTVLAGLWFIIGIGLGFLFQYHRAFFAAAVIIAALFLFCVWFFGLRDCSRSGAAVVLALCLLCGLGAGRFSLALAECRSLPAAVSGEIEGRVASRSGTGEILLADVRADGEAVPGRVLFYAEGVEILRTDGEEGLAEGDRVRFSGRLSREDPEADGFRPSRWLRGVRYVCYPGEVRAEAGRPDVFGGVRRYLRTRLSQALKGDSYAVGLALLIGDTGEMEELDYENFRELGVLHIFAVSGLHFSSLFYLLFRIFKLLPRKWGYLPVFLILLFYAGVCDFSPSVLRAFVMICVFMGAKLLGRRYDLLSSLFASVLIVTAIQPFHLFSPGFVLSCMGVLSIVLLAPPLRRLFRFLPGRIREAAAVCTAAQIGLVPVVSYYFGTFYTLALAVNILLSPVVNAAFLLLFVLAVFALPFPPLWFLFSAPRVLLEFLLLFARISESAPVSIALRAGPDGVLFGIALLVLLSDFVDLRAAARLAGCGILVLLFFSAQGLALWLRSGDRVRFAEEGALFSVGGETVFVDSGRGDGEALAEFFRHSRTRRVGLWLVMDTEGFLSRFAGAAEEVSTEQVCFADRFSAEESGMLVYVRRHYGAQGLLAEPGSFGRYGEMRYAYAEEGGVIVGAAGSVFGFARDISEERAVSALARPDTLFALSCADYSAEKVFCFGRGEEERGHERAGELLFGLKDGIINKIPY